MRASSEVEPHPRGASSPRMRRNLTRGGRPVLGVPEKFVILPEHE
jgi:hypothetical protein